MKNKILFLLASFITLLCGPGAGHLIVKEWKKAAIFISVSLAFIVILAYKFISSVGQETIDAVINLQNIDPLMMESAASDSLEKFKDIFYKFKEENSSFMWIFNISFAAFWAYSIYDLFKITKKKDQQANNE